MLVLKVLPELSTAKRLVRSGRSRTRSSTTRTSWRYRSAARSVRTTSRRSARLPRTRPFTRLSSRGSMRAMSRRWRKCSGSYGGFAPFCPASAAYADPGRCIRRTRELMGLKLSAAWFIDSWCVLDGLAFASLRKPRNWAAATLVEPVTTVLIGPPDWRAVSISRLPTALAATRGPFQEGVLDDDGRENCVSVAGSRPPDGPAGLPRWRARPRHVRRVRATSPRAVGTAGWWRCRSQPVERVAHRARRRRYERRPIPGLPA